MGARTTGWESVRRALPWIALALWFPGLILVAHLVERSWAMDSAELAKTQARAAPRPMTLRLSEDVGKATRRSRITLSGGVTPGSTVSVGTRRARVDGGRFRVRVPLKVGTNTLTVTARRSGYSVATERVRVRRSKPRPKAVPAPAPAPTPTTPQEAPPQTAPQQPPQQGSSAAQP